MDSLKAVMAFASALLVLFFLYPLLVLFGIGAGQVVSAFAVPSFLQSVGVTLLISTFAAAISVILGTPLGYMLARSEFRLKELVDALVDVPIMIPHIVVGIMIVLAFASDAGTGPYMGGLGLGVINTIVGATLAVTYVSATYTIRVVQSAVATLDPDAELTSRSLGAGRTFTFANVVLPQIRRAIASGALLAWARSVSEIGALFVVAYYVSLGGLQAYPASIYIYESYIGTGLASAVRFSAAIVLVSLAVFLVYRIAVRTKSTRGR